MKHVSIVIFCAVFLLMPSVFGIAQEQEGEATWHETDSLSLNASHADLPIGTRVRVMNLEKDADNEKIVYVNITNRIHNDPVHILDLSAEAARLLEMNETGRTRIRLEVIGGFEEHLLPEAEEEILVFDDEPDPYKAPEPVPAVEIVQAAVPEITAVVVGNNEKPAEQPPPPQPPTRTTVPQADSSSDQPEWPSVQNKDSQAAAPPAPLPVQNVSDARTAAVRVIVNINGQDHVVDVIPDQPAANVVRPPAPPPQPPVPIAQSSPVPPTINPSVIPPRGGPAAKVVPRMPDPGGNGVYRVQVGAFSRTALAQDAYDRLRNAGFRPAFERHENLYRVVITGVRAAEMSQVAQRLGAAGFAEVWIREEH